MTTLVAVVLISSGAFFLTVSALGLIRLPDFYSRAHAVAKSETLGVMLTIAGVIVHAEFRPGALRLLFVLVFAFLANPTAIHALARAAQRAGVSAWTRESP